MSKSRRLDSFGNNGIHSIVKNRFLNHGVEIRCYQMGEPTALTNSHLPLTLFLLQPLSLSFF